MRDAVAPQRGMQLDVYVPENFVGRLIGKRGANLQNIRATTQVDVRVDHESKGEALRRATLTGPNAAQLEIAKDLVVKSIAPPEASNDPDRGPDLEERIMIPTTNVAKVIGAKGSVIKALQSVMKCRIRINQDATAPEAAERALDLVGSAESIHAVKEWIAQLGASEGESYKGVSAVVPCFCRVFLLCSFSGALHSLGFVGRGVLM